MKSEFSLCQQTRYADKILNRLTSPSRELFELKQRVAWLSRDVSFAGSGKKQAVFTVGWRRLKSLYSCASPTSPHHLTPVELYTTGGKIVETLFLNGFGFGEQNNPHPSLSLPFKVGCLLFSLGSLKSAATLHGRRDGEGKPSFCPFGGGKTLERSFRAKCLDEFCLWCS